MKLYKYISEKYIIDDFRKGKILFRNLESFRQIEGARNDIYEGSHVDSPDIPAQIYDVTAGRYISGDFAFHRAVNTENIYCYCMSTRLDQHLFEKFNCNYCIEISDTKLFLEQFSRALVPFFLKRAIPKKKQIFITNNVRYYAINKAETGLDITQGTNLPFLKRKEYEGEAEFRIIFGKQKDFKEKMTLQMDNHPDHKIEYGVAKDTIINIGSIAEITRVITRENV